MTEEAFNPETDIELPPETVVEQPETGVEPAAEAPAEAPAPVAAAPKEKGLPRKNNDVKLRVGDKTYILWDRYPMPVKAPRFDVTVNDVICQAATSAGKGKAYTTILYNKTGLCFEVMLAAGANVTLAVPYGYVFDSEERMRPSWVKRQEAKAIKEASPDWAAKQEAKKAAATARLLAAAAAKPKATPVPGAAAKPAPALEETVPEAVSDAPKAKRRGK